MKASAISVSGPPARSRGAMQPNRASASTARGVALMFGSAAGFGLSGPFVAPLLQAGWSPASAVAVRAFVAGLILLVPGLLAVRGRVRQALKSWRLVLAYALIAVVATQLFYFAAIAHLEVSTAVLIKCTAPVLVVLYLWIRTGAAPRTLTILGAIGSLVGVALVVDPTQMQNLSLLGLLLSFLAAVAMAAYFFVSSHPSGEMPALTLLSFGLMIGGVVTALLGIIGVLPFSMTFGTAIVAGQELPWYVPMAVVVVLATVVPYVCGLLGTRAAGPRIASFIALTETVFAVLVAWAILSQVPGVGQIIGGVLVLTGVFAVQLDRGKTPGRRLSRQERFLRPHRR